MESVAGIGTLIPGLWSRPLRGAGHLALRIVL